MATVKATAEMVAQSLRETDWSAQDALTDVDVARAVDADPDAALILSEAQAVAAMVRTVRKRLGLSQTEFAARYHIPAGTLRDWEQNRKKPDSTAVAFLRVIAREPEVVAKALEPT
jgi:putative transcriptional regulator